MWILIIHFFAATLPLAHIYMPSSRVDPSTEYKHVQLWRKSTAVGSGVRWRKMAKPAGNQASQSASRRLYNVNRASSKAKIMRSCDDCSWNAPSGKHIKAFELRTRYLRSHCCCCDCRDCSRLELFRSYDVHHCTVHSPVWAHMCWINSTRSACNLIVFN